MKMVQENQKGKVYQADGFKIYYRHAGSISGDNAINPNEKIYLITGSAKVTIETRLSTIHAPTYFQIPERTPHRIEALTDICFIVL